MTALQDRIGGRRLALVFMAVLLLACLAAIGLQESSIIQSDAGDITLAPKGNLTVNLTKIQMLSPDGSWSCCGPNVSGNWTCSGGEC